MLAGDWLKNRARHSETIQHVKAFDHAQPVTSDERVFASVSAYRKQSPQIGERYAMKHGVTAYWTLKYVEPTKAAELLLTTRGPRMKPHDYSLGSTWRDLTNQVAEVPAQFDDCKRARRAMPEVTAKLRAVQQALKDREAMTSDPDRGT